jgi:hypothetical protein
MGHRWTSLLLMYAGHMLVHVLRCRERNCQGPRTNAHIWTKTPFKSRTKNRCLNAMVGVGKFGGAIMLCSIDLRDERVGALMLGSILCGDERGDGYVV